jgi:hypothetical protein
VSWLSPARKDFEQCPERVRDIITNALAIAAEGGKAAIATPLHHVELVASRLKRLSEILRHGWN